METWVIVGPEGLKWVGLVDPKEAEELAWTYAFGWPDDEDIKGYKHVGYYAAPATITWKKPT